MVEIIVVLERAGGDRIVSALYAYLNEISLPLLASLPVDVSREMLEKLSGDGQIDDVDDISHISILVMPDEFDIERALGWRAPWDDPDRREWFLIDADSPVQMVAGEHQIVADHRLPDLSPAGPRTNLSGEPGERMLVEAWGRALSVSGRWREVLLEGLSAPGVLRSHRLAPGLATIVGKIREGIAVEEVLGGVEEGGAPLEALKAFFPVTSLFDPGFVRPVSLTVALEGPTERSYRDWAGPAVDALTTRDLVAWGIVDLDYLFETLIKRASEHEMHPSIAPELPDRITETIDLDLDGCSWWVLEDVPLSIHMGQLVETIIREAISPAEAASLAVSAAAAEGRAAAQVIARLRTRLGDDQVEVLALECLQIGDVGPDGGRAMMLNLRSLLEKFGGDPDAPGLEREIANALRFMDDTDRHQDPILRLMGSGDHWFLRHLRGADFVQGKTAFLYKPETFVDRQGRSFSLVAGIENAERLGYLTIEAAATLEASGVDLDRELAARPSKARFEARARALRGQNGVTIGAMLEGPNIASCMAHPALIGRLRELMAKVVARPGDLEAFAPSTDTLILAPDLEWTGTALRLRLQDGPLDGGELGLLGDLRDAAPAAGRIRLSWQARPL